MWMDGGWKGGTPEVQHVHVHAENLYFPPSYLSSSVSVDECHVIAEMVQLLDIHPLVV